MCGISRTSLEMWWYDVVRVFDDVKKWCLEVKVETNPLPLGLLKAFGR